MRLVAKSLVFCNHHWRLVPERVQTLLTKHYRRDEDTVEWIATVFVAISCLAIEEGKPLPQLEPDPANGTDEPSQPAPEAT